MDDYIEDLLTTNEMEIDYIEALDSAITTENSHNSMTYFALAEMDTTLN